MPRIKNYLLRTFFEKRSDKHVVCKNEECNNKLLIIHAGNLERHLKTFHPGVYYNYLQKKINFISNKTKNDSIKLSCTVNKKHIQLALVELFTKCGRPLSLAEDQPFKMLLNPMLDELKIKLNEQYVMEKIAEYSLNLKKGLIKELGSRLISLKIDAVAGASESLLSVSVQFIKTSGVVLKTLGIKQLTQEYSSGYLKFLILDILAEYNINLDQVVTITTDSGADTFQAAHDLHCDMNKSSQAAAAGVPNDLSCMKLDLSIDGIKYVHGGAQTLKMCVLEVLESPDIKLKLDIIRAVVKKLQNEFYLKISKSANYKRPLLDDNAKWTSTYNMLERFIELKDFIADIDRDYAAFELTNEIWTFANEFLSVFRIIYINSRKLQSTNFIYSDLYIEITNIALQLDNLPKSDLKFQVIESLNRQKLKLFENDLFVTAVFLDPRIKVCLASDQCAKAKSCIIQLYTRLLYMREGDIKVSKPTTSLQPSPPSSASFAASIESGNAEDALEEYFKAFDQVANSNIFTTSQQIEQDILAYGSQGRLGIKENILEFWSKQNNALMEIAQLVLGIPCTQASVDRLYAALDYLQANEGSKLSSANLEHILLVKSNAEFIYD